MRALSWYSSRQNVSCWSWSPARPNSYSRRMSPPAQKALLAGAADHDPRDGRRRRSHASSAAAISRTIVSVSAFSAFGRLRTMTPAAPRRSISASASVGRVGHAGATSFKTASIAADTASIGAMPSTSRRRPRWR